MNEIESIIRQLHAFRDQRDWEQFHDSRNLALALSIEAAELNELFLWKKEDNESQIDLNRLEEELADVFAYAFLLASKHGLDVKRIIENKMMKNARKYPVDKSRGRSDKYSEL